MSGPKGRHLKRNGAGATKAGRVLLNWFLKLTFISGYSSASVFSKASRLDTHTHAAKALLPVRSASLRGCVAASHVQNLAAHLVRAVSELNTHVGLTDDHAGELTSLLGVGGSGLDMALLCDGSIKLQLGCWTRSTDGCGKNGVTGEG